MDFMYNIVYIEICIQMIIEEIIQLAVRNLFENIHNGPKEVGQLLQSPCHTCRPSAVDPCNGR